MLVIISMWVEPIFYPITGKQKRVPCKSGFKNSWVNQAKCWNCALSPANLSRSVWQTRRITVIPLSISHALPQAPGFAVAPQGTLVHSWGTLAPQRNNPGSILSPHAAHLVLAHHVFCPSELCAPAPRPHPGHLLCKVQGPFLAHPLAQKRTHFAQHRKCSTVICGMCGFLKKLHYKLT